MCKLKMLISLILIFIIILSGTALANENTVTLFNDVPESHWAYKAIHDLRLLKITDGVGNNQYGNNNDDYKCK